MTVLCLGEPLVTLTPPPHTSFAVADSAHLGIGGAELNVAVHLARLGVAVAYAGAVGTDPFGVRIRDALLAEGVDCSLLVEEAGSTGLYCKEPGRTLYLRSGSAGSRRRPLPTDSLATVDQVHLTGVSLALSGAIVSTAANLCVPQRSWRVSFDANHRPALWAAEIAGPAILHVARAADLVFVGRDEADALWSITDRDEIRSLIGTDTELVIKDGPDPVEIWADGQWWSSAPPAIEVTEPVGAGDAFAAAYLAARRAGDAAVAAAERGHRLAAHVMSSVSDQGVRGDAAYF